MRIEQKNINRNLPKKGFIKEEGKHHIYFHHHYNGKATGVHTYMSHGSGHRDIAGNVLSKMKNQLKLDTTNDLVDLVNCPMSKEQYIMILREKKFISDE